MNNVDKNAILLAMNNYDINGLVGSKPIGVIVDEIRLREKTRRKEKKITQRQLAELSLVPYATIRRFEKTGEISFSSMVKIIDALGYQKDLDQLLSKPSFSSIKDML